MQLNRHTPYEHSYCYQGKEKNRRARYIRQYHNHLVIGSIGPALMHIHAQARRQNGTLHRPGNVLVGMDYFNIQLDAAVFRLGTQSTAIGIQRHHQLEISHLTRR